MSNPRLPQSVLGNSYALLPALSYLRFFFLLSESRAMWLEPVASRRWTIRRPNLKLLHSLEKCFISAYCKEMTEISRKSLKPLVIKGLIQSVQESLLWVSCRECLLRDWNLADEVHSGALTVCVSLSMKVHVLQSTPWRFCENTIRVSLTAVSYKCQC